MAVLWIHTASLLVLLVTSCQGTQAAVAQHLCGSHLVDALYLVCGHNGFRFTPGSSEPQQGFIPPRLDRAQAAVGGNEPAESTFTDQTMVKRNVVQQCCIRPCTLFDLLNYCLPSFE